MKEWIVAYVGMGSNLGAREEHLRRAAAGISAIPGVTLIRVSSLYETDPVGGPPQGPYLNAAAEVTTRLAPEGLLTALQVLEREAGRSREVRWGPRTLDLDLLLYGDEAIDRPGLTVPHPRLTGRAFVLRPLAELEAGRTVPGAGATIGELLERLDERGRYSVTGREAALCGRPAGSGRVNDPGSGCAMTHPDGKGGHV